MSDFFGRRDLQGVSTFNDPNSLSRLEAKFSPEPNTGCWLWHGAMYLNGYGVVRSPREKRNVGAHRVVYEVTRGAIPEGMDLDHLCRVRCCVNPDHPEPVTRRENLRRGAGAGLAGALQAAKVSCPQGHPYSLENTAHFTTSRGGPGRYCKQCKREKSRARRSGR